MRVVEGFLFYCVVESMNEYDFDVHELMLNVNNIYLRTKLVITINCYRRLQRAGKYLIK